MSAKQCRRLIGKTLFERRIIYILDEISEMANNILLYKYRTWDDDFHKNCLRKCEFFAAAPTSLNDPFDCQIEYDFSLLDSEEKQEAFFKNQLFISYPFPDRADYQIALAKFKNLFNTDRDGFSNKYNEHTFNLESKIQGVLSLSGVWNEPTLWAHYASDYKGYCVGLDFTELIGSLQLFAYKKVDYLQELPKIDPSLDLLKALNIRLFTKTMQWSNEDEYRFLRSWLNSGGFPDNDARKIVLQPNVIKEVILGKSISPQHEQEIRQLCEKNSWSVFKIRKAQYKLDRYN